MSKNRAKISVTIKPKDDKKGDVKPKK